MNDNYIAVDWGSTHLRAWHIVDGQCRHRLRLPYGVTRLNGQSAESIFSKYLLPIESEQSLPFYLAGMVGSDIGWHPVDYLTCPQPVTALSQHLQQVTDNAWIVPGLKLQRDDGECNVMRGEETLLAGAYQLHPDTCYVLPGTHSKWVLTSSEARKSPQATVENFTTALTGELHHLLLSHSLLGAGLPPQMESPQAFIAGARRAQEHPALISELFGVRAGRILNKIAACDVSEYLSGLLIGNEIHAMRQRYQLAQVTLVADRPLASRYRQLLESAGITVCLIDPEQAFLQGIRSIHYGR